MPGAYTHITMVNEASERSNMEAFDIPTSAIAACGRWLKYCELGVVSPDLPYLDLASGVAKQWADSMHYQNTDGVIRSGIEDLRSLSLSADDREKGLAWLLGYTTHVVMDCTIHPVINLKVGPYEQNKVAHRNCEMHQDAFVFQRLNLGITTSKYLASGISECLGSDGRFDAAINRFWADALRKVHPVQFANGAPDPAAWHSWFTKTVELIGDSGDVLFAIGRHVAPDAGLVYPRSEEIELTFIEGLRAPDGSTMHFNAVFDKAKQHVCKTWNIVARGALGIDEQYKTILRDCNLDTGRDATGRMMFWEGV